MIDNEAITIAAMFAAEEVIPSDTSPLYLYRHPIDFFYLKDFPTTKAGDFQQIFDNHLAVLKAHQYKSISLEELQQRLDKPSSIRAFYYSFLTARDGSEISESELASYLDQYRDVLLASPDEPYLSIILQTLSEMVFHKEDDERQLSFYDSTIVLAEELLKQTDDTHTMGIAAIILGLDAKTDAEGWRKGIFAAFSSNRSYPRRNLCRSLSNTLDANDHEFIGKIIPFISGLTADRGRACAEKLSELQVGAQGFEPHIQALAQLLTRSYDYTFDLALELLTKTPSENATKRLVDHGLSAVPSSRRDRVYQIVRGRTFLGLEPNLELAITGNGEFEATNLLELINSASSTRILATYPLYSYNREVRSKASGILETRDLEPVTELLINAFSGTWPMNIIPLFKILDNASVNQALLTVGLQSYHRDVQDESFGILKTRDIPSFLDFMSNHMGGRPLEFQIKLLAEVDSQTSTKLLISYGFASYNSSIRSDTFDALASRNLAAYVKSLTEAWGRQGNKEIMQLLVKTEGQASTAALVEFGIGERYNTSITSLAFEELMTEDRSLIGLEDVVASKYSANGEEVSKLLAKTRSTESSRHLVDYALKDRYDPGNRVIARDALKGRLNDIRSLKSILEDMVATNHPGKDDAQELLELI